jgi:hypothetical protein
MFEIKLAVMTLSEAAVILPATTRLLKIPTVVISGWYGVEIVP